MEKNKELAATSEKIIILSRALTWDGKEYKEFNFDIENLKGRDLIEIQTDMKLSGIPMVSSMQVDEAYLSRLAAKSAGVEVEVIEALPFNDFRRVINTMSGLMVKLG